MEGLEELTILVSNTPSWYPQGKYGHGGKEVLKTVEERYMGQPGLEDKIVVHYTDGTSTCFGTWHSATGGEALSGQRSLSEMRELIAHWGFISHMVESTWPGGKIITSESVPVEDPSRWVTFKRFSGTRCVKGEQRVAARPAKRDGVRRLEDSAGRA